jgi:hypothetical protein
MRLFLLDTIVLATFATGLAIALAVTFIALGSMK